MKTALLRLRCRAACLVLAGGLLTSCSLLPAASPRPEGTAASQAPQYYSESWLTDDALHFIYSYAGNGGGTILRGGKVLYQGSRSDSVQLVRNTLTGAELPVPETALDCLVVDEGGQRLIFNCYDLPEGLTYAYDDPDQPLHQYVLVTDREGNVLLREDGCTAQSLASYRGSFADWLTLSWFRGADWGIAREGLYNILTGQLLTGEDDSSASACGVGIACLQSRQDSHSILYDLNSDEAVELGRFDWCVMDHTPGCVTLLGSDDPDNPYTLIDLASGEKTAVQRCDRDYHSGNVAVLTADNVLKVYDGTTGALLTDVEVTPIEEARHVSVSALPGGYALLQYDDEDYNTLAIQTYGGEGLLW